MCKVSSSSLFLGGGSKRDLRCWRIMYKKVRSGLSYRYKMNKHLGFSLTHRLMREPGRCCNGLKEKWKKHKCMWSKEDWMTVQMDTNWRFPEKGGLSFPRTEFICINTDKNYFPLFSVICYLAPTDSESCDLKGVPYSFLLKHRFFFFLQRKMAYSINMFRFVVRTKYHNL